VIEVVFEGSGFDSGKANRSHGGHKLRGIVFVKLATTVMYRRSSFKSSLVTSVNR
jgi:hypothetical protein